MQNMNQNSYSLPVWVSYGVSIVKIVEKIARVITALHCIYAGMS